MFPNLLKNSIVVPIHKNGKRDDPNNYRPISILTIFFKVLEKLFYSRFISFINRNNILHTNQFGFRTGKSTSLTLTQVISSLLIKCNANKRVIIALLDLEKAFDFINHDLLLTKVKHYGIRGTPLQWISNYLTDRTQKCKVNGALSNKQPISAEVPQESILGPILFILFFNDVFQFNSANIKLYLYANDAAIIFTADNDTELQTIINDFFVKYFNWCSMNCIVVNPLKSNFLLFNHTNVVVSINGHVLDNPHCVKYHGILIDDKLAWYNHIKYVIKLCSQRIGKFKKYYFIYQIMLPCCITMHLFYHVFHTVLLFGLITLIKANKNSLIRLIKSFLFLLSKTN